MPPSKLTSSSKKLKQVTLSAFLSPSPGPSSSSNLSPKRRAPKSIRAQKASSSIVSSGSEANESSTSDVGAIKFEAEAIATDEEDSSPRRRTNRKRLTRSRAINDEEVNSSSNGIDSEAEIGIPVRWNPKGKKRRQRAQVPDSDSGAQNPEKRRKLVKGVRPPSPLSLSDEVDVDSKFGSPLYAEHSTMFTPKE